MAGLVVLDIDGDDALNKLLLTLPDNVQKRVIVSAVTKATTPLVRAVRKATPIGKTGNLKKSVKKIIRRRTKKGPMALVGHVWPIGAHAHLVEKGTKERQHKSGHRTGVMPPNPYMLPAFNTQAASVEANLRTLIVQGIEKEATKLANKAK